MASEKEPEKATLYRSFHPTLPGDQMLGRSNHSSCILTIYTFSRFDFPNVYILHKDFGDSNFTQ